MIVSPLAPIGTCKNRSYLMVCRFWEGSEKIAFSVTSILTSPPEIISSKRT